jgi:hypothetical protein
LTKKSALAGLRFVALTFNQSVGSGDLYKHALAQIDGPEKLRVIHLSLGYGVS